jgi:hypothetical protein
LKPPRKVERRADALSNGDSTIPLRLYSPQGLSDVELPGLAFAGAKVNQTPEG